MPEPPTLPVPDASGNYEDTMPYVDLLRLVIELRDDVRALAEQMRAVQNKMAKVPSEQARLL